MPSIEKVDPHPAKAIFKVTRTQSLQADFARTKRSESNKDKAIEVTSEAVYNRYTKYLRGCEHYFADEMLDCSLVTYLKPGAAA